jgi:hypothetical protein
MLEVVCQEFESLFVEYLDGSLEPRTSSRVAAHALRCRSCRALLDDVKARLREDSEVEPLDARPGLARSLESIPGGRPSIECARFEENITEFLDGFVPARAYRRFQSHSAECDSCSELLTDVVYAVAACHSVHTYEELDVPDSLTKRLLLLGGCPRPAPTAGRWLKKHNILMTRMDRLITRKIARWSMLAAATWFVLLLGFSDDLSLNGIYRQVQVKAGELYTQGLDIYAAKDEVAAGVERVGSDIGEIWVTMGGDQTQENTGNGK